MAAVGARPPTHPPTRPPARADPSPPSFRVSLSLLVFTVLQLFLSSPKPTMRFAAIRTLNKAAMTHAFAVAACNLDMENLITDPNRSISTLAITTLLKVREPP